MIGREKGEEESGEIRYESIRSAKSMRGGRQRWRQEIGEKRGRKGGGKRQEKKGRSGVKERWRECNAVMCRTALWLFSTVNVCC